MSTQLAIQSNLPNGYDYSLNPLSGGTAVSGSSAGTSTTAVVPTSGQYNLILTDPSTSTVLHNSVVDTNTTSAVYAQAVNPVDSATVGVASVPVTSGQASSQSGQVQPAIIQPVLNTEEFVAPNGSSGRYFTCQDARLYIGSVFIDENIYVQYLVTTTL
jgi:hypothetical protein